MIWNSFRSFSVRGGVGLVGVFFGWALVSGLETHASSQTEMAQSIRSVADGFQSESEIVSKVHAVHQFEIRAGQLAKQKGSTERVRRYGDRLARDHQFADEMLLSLAQKKGWIVGTVVPKSADEKMKKQLRELKDLELAKGADFDSLFLNQMDLSHEEVIEDFSAMKGRLPEQSELRATLGKVIPILKQHLQLAHHLEA